MKPVQIPQFAPETDEEKALWETVDAAREAMR
jgi:hypothetical protein